MNMTRKLILIIASISLGGCITYPDGGYYSSPDVNAYYGDGYYGSNDDYYDDGYNGNYGQYEYYTAQPSVSLNFVFNYGYSGYSSYYPYYGYNSGYYNYRPCNSWSSYCYAYRPSYGWGYWPVYVYRPTIHHHHYYDKPRKNDKHYSHDNKNNNNPYNDNRDNRPIREPEYAGQYRPVQSQPQVSTRPTKPSRKPEQYKTPTVPVGNNPYVGVNPVPPQINNRAVDSGVAPRYRTPNDNVQLPRYDVSKRPAQQRVIDEDSDQYHGVRTYTVQQPAYSRDGMVEQPVRQIRKREDLNQHYGAPNTPQQGASVQTGPQNNYNRYVRQNTSSTTQPVQSNRNAPPQYTADVAQKPQAQPSQTRQQRASKPERRESKKSNIEHED